MPRTPFGNPANDEVPDEFEAIVEAEEPTDVGEPAPPVAAEPAPDQPPEAVASVVAATSDERYVLGRWGGIDQFRCAAERCKFDTLDRSEFEEHWQKRHAPPPPPKPQPSALVGPTGESLTF